MSPHEELVKALNILDQRGWSSQGWGHTQVCPLHALHVARNGENPTPFSFFEMITEESAQRFADAAGIPRNYIGRWNDSPDTTEAMVREAFRKAIAATAPEPEDVPLGEVVEGTALAAG